jgi:hypothetical protein
MSSTIPTLSLQSYIIDSAEESGPNPSSTRWHYAVATIKTGIYIVLIAFDATKIRRIKQAYDPVVSSNEVNVLRYCTWVLFLRSEHVTK